MQLTEHRPQGHYFIRGVSAQGIQVVDQVYATSLLLDSQHLHTDWPVRDISELTESCLQPLFDMQPELVLLGTGQIQRFPEVAIRRAFLARGIGLEVMTLQAACRTFNVVVGENRRAAAALIWEPL